MITFAQETESLLNNRRSTPRWLVQGRCMYRMDNEFTSHAGHAENVSCRGARIITDHHYVINQKVNLKIYLSETDVVKLCGTVVWTRDINFQNEIGIRFYNTNNETQDAIVQYALYSNKDGLMDYWFKDWEGR